MFRSVRCTYERFGKPTQQVQGGQVVRVAAGCIALSLRACESDYEPQDREWREELGADAGLLAGSK